MMAMPIPGGGIDIALLIPGGGIGNLCVKSWCLLYVWLLLLLLFVMFWLLLLLFILDWWLGMRLNLHLIKLEIAIELGK